MKVNVAGAGAGKTTKMADYITAYPLSEGKIIFCIAFTNAAVEHIKEKVVNKLGSIPKNIKISTIHSFLYQELIVPYYHFLYGVSFEHLSNITLPENDKIKNKILSDLEKTNILHVTRIPKKAKYVVYQKSTDRKSTQIVRQAILKRFKNYCAAIFVDEAQDIDEDINIILECLDKSGIEIILYGDPKQDVKGKGCFRHIIECSKDTTYISTCYRCPQKHLDLSNLLAFDSEKQVADEKNAEGNILIVFASDIDNIQRFIDNGNYGLRYISMKRDQYDTHDELNTNHRFESLWNEVYHAMNDKWYTSQSEIEIKRATFYITEQMLRRFDSSGNAKLIISSFINAGAFDFLDKRKYMRMISAFKKQNSAPEKRIIVKSIEFVKGLEANRCFFILTKDLAPYLFGINTVDNKTNHLLYVALTRSLDHLTIMISKEVEDEYSKSAIVNFFRDKSIMC